MHVVGKKRLLCFGRLHADAMSALAAWLCEAEEAAWTTPNEIKKRYPQVSFLHGNRLIFNIKGNRYRLQVRIDFALQTVLIEQVGTHAEYSKWKL